MAGNRIRCVRPELLEHPRFAELSDGARGLWLGLYPCWDDEGRSLGGLGYVAGRVYFARAKSKGVIGRELAELEAAGWLIRYEMARVEYLAVRGWNDPASPTYQYIKSPRPSKLPAPPSVPGAKPGAKPGTTDQEGDQEGEREREREREGEARRSRGDTLSPGVADEPNPLPGQPAPTLPSPAAPDGGSAWHRHQRWWDVMLEADRRIRAAGIQPNAPQLSKAPAGVNELNMSRFERQLIDGGATPDEVDAKMRHIVAVAEAEALRKRSRRYFRPAMIWDPKRATHAADIALEDARMEPPRPGAPSPAPPRSRDRDPAPKPISPENLVGPAEFATARRLLGFEPADEGGSEP